MVRTGSLFSGGDDGGGGDKDKKEIKETLKEFLEPGE